MPLHQPRTPRPTIDIVIPAFNEASTIGALLEALFRRLVGLPYAFEVIVVDDGSADRTAAIAALYNELLPVRVVRLTRNFGKEAALLAGLDHARGAATILMDADLQHPTALIPEFLSRWEQGYECVYAVKEDRREEGLAKRIATRLFYRCINRGAEVTIPADAVDFRLLDQAAVRALCALRERVRFTKGLYAWLGFRSLAVPFTPLPRAGGRSHFNAARLVRLGWDGLTSFSDLPLRAAGVVGAAVAAGASLYALFMLTREILLGIDPPGWSIALAAVAFLGGLQILFLGVLGQYVRSIAIEAKQRPSYLLREIVEPAQVEAGAVGPPEERIEPKLVSLGRSAA